MADGNAKRTVKGPTVIQPDAQGAYHLPASAGASVSKVDAADIDIVLTTKNGEHYILPGAALEAMTKPDAAVTFSDTSITVDALLGEVGSISGLGVNIPVPSSFSAEDAKGSDAQQQQQQSKADSASQDNVAALPVDAAASVEKLIAKVDSQDSLMHRHDFDFVPLPRPAPPYGAPPMSPGEPPPASQTPIILFTPGNVTASTTYQPGDAGNPKPGYLSVLAPGGMPTSDVSEDLAPNSPLLFSTVTYENLSSQNIAYYAEGQANQIAGSVGVDTASVYANAGINQTVGAKEFILSIVGASIRIDNMSITGVPEGDTIVGGTQGVQAADGSYTWTLPINDIAKAIPFTLLYPVNQTSDPNNPASWPTITVYVNGLSTHGFDYHSKASFSFEYLAQSDPSQTFDLPLNTYALPTLDTPYDITLGDGNNLIYGGRNNDTIVSGNGNSQIYESNGNDLIAVGTGNNTIVAGNGNDSITFGGGSNTISVGTGNDTITGNDGGNNAITVSSLATESLTGSVNIATGQGNDTITVYGGHGTITANAGTGNTQIAINTETGSTSAFTLTTTGTGTTNITAGDGEYTVNTGAGASTISLGAGNDSITTGAGDAQVSVGYGQDTIVTGSGNSNITVSGGGGTITTGASGSNNSNITVSNVSGLDTYTFNLNGTGGAVINGGDDTYIVNGGTGTGNDTINLGVGNDSIVTGSGSAQVSVGHGHDTITTGSGNSNVTVSGGGGTITTNSSGMNVSDITVQNASVSDVYLLNLNGSGGAIVTGSDGNYTVNGGTGTGNDTINLGVGNDSIVTGSGNAQVSVGHGHDTITTGSGNSYVTVSGGGGTITTNSTGTNLSNIQVQNTSASDVYNINLNGAGSAVVNAVDGNYTVNGATGTGNDTVTLGAGNSSISTGSGNAQVSVGHGHDTITTGSGNSNITVNGGGGTITTYSSGLNASNITVQNTSGSDVYNINLDGTGNAVVNAVAGNYTVNGSAGTGNDTVTLGAGNSSISTGSGSAQVSVGHGNDTITTGSGNSNITVNGGGGTITTYSSGSNASNITVQNTSGSDVYNINLDGTGNAVVNAVAGNYTVNGSTGTGNDTVTLGAGNSSISTGTGNAQVSVGYGRDTITTGSGNSNITVSGGGGTITTYSSGANVSNITVNNAAGLDTYTFNLDGNGSASVTGGNDTYIVNSPTGTGNDTINVGNGNDTINTGQANASITVGNGNTTITTGSGTNTISVGTGTHSFIASASNSTVNAAAYGATITGGSSDTITAASTTNNYTLGGNNDVINVNNAVGAFASNGNNNLINVSTTTTVGSSFYGGSGSDTFVGAGTVTGIGADTYYGNGGNSANNGNNIFTNPHAGDFYYGTGGAGVGSIAASAVNTSLTLNGNSYAISFPWQINGIDYSTATGASTINLSGTTQNGIAAGTGYGGQAQGSTYGFTSVAGYNSINEIIGNTPGSNNDGVYSSYSNSIFINISNVDDHFTASTQHNIIVNTGNDASAIMGAFSEQLINLTTNGRPYYVKYNYSPTAVVLNLTATTQAESFTSSGSIAALSGGGYGSDTTSYANGDTFTPAAGTTDNVGSSLYYYLPASTVAGFGKNIVYLPTQSNIFVASSDSSINCSDYVFGPNNRPENYLWSNGNDELYGTSAAGSVYNGQCMAYLATANQIVALSYAFAYTSGFTTVNNTSELQGTGSTATLHGYGPTGADAVFSGYAYATDTTQSAGTMTLLNNVEYVQGGSNDTIIGDNNTNYLQGGSNNLIVDGNGNDTIYGGSGNNTITAGNGNVIVSIGRTTGFTVGNNSVTLGTGNKSVLIGQSTVTSSGSETVTAGAGNSTVTIYSNGNNSVTLGAGNSNVTVQGSGTNSVTLGAGTSVITGGSGINQYHIDTSGTEALTFTAHTVSGSSWTDSVTGTGVNITAISTGSTNNGLDAFWGNAGSDTFNAGIAADSFTGGTGAANVFNASSIAGAGVSSFTGGTGTNTFNGSTVTGSSGVIDYGALAGGTSGNDTFNAGVGASTYYGGTGNNVFNASTLAGALSSSFYANVTGNTGNGNDTFNGAGTVTGIGADTFYATGSGNHYFLNPHAGDAYYATGGAGVGAIAASAANTSITVGGNSYAINFPWQINAIDYSTAVGNSTINLTASVQGAGVAAGTGSGSLGQGATYGFTSVAGYNSINEIIGNLSNTVYASYSSSIFVNINNVNDLYTLPTQHNIVALSGAPGNYYYFEAGPASEQIANVGSGYFSLDYSHSPKAIVLNLSSTTQTESFTSSGSINALTGSGYGSDTTTYAQGDTFTPVSGTADNLGGLPMIVAPASTVAGFGTNIIYLPNGSPQVRYDSNSPTTNTADYVFGTGTSTTYYYHWSNGNDEFAGSAASTNNQYSATANQIVALSYALAFANGFTTVNNTSELQGSGSTATLHGYGPTGADAVFAGYAYATDTTQSANTQTLLNNVEYVSGASNDTIIGDNNNNYLLLQGTGLTVYDGTGNDTIDVRSNGGFNQIHLGSSGATTFEFYNVTTSSPTEIVLGNGTFFGGTNDLDTIFGSATTPTYNAQFNGGTYEIYSNGSHVTIMGSTYSSGVTASGSTDYGNFDNLYYADTNTTSVCWQGGNVIIVGENDGAVLNAGNLNSIIYENATVAASFTDTILGGGGAQSTLRMPGLVLTAESATTDPFSSSVVGTEAADNHQFQQIKILDLRTGTDSLTSSTYNGHSYIIDTFGTSLTATNAISMSAQDIINLNHGNIGGNAAGSAASSSTPFTLYLDQGDTFTPDYTHGSTTMAGGAYNGIAASNYNTNSVTHTVSYEYLNGGTNVAYLNVHFGA